MATASYSWSCLGVPDTFRVYESSNGGALSLAQEVPGTQTAWNHLGILPGDYSAYITAVYGGFESNPCSLARFQVVQRDFSISAPSTVVQVPRRGVAEFWVTLRGLGGFSGLADLSITTSNGTTAIVGPGPQSVPAAGDGAGDDAGDSSVSPASTLIASVPVAGTTAVLSQQSTFVTSQSSVLVAAAVYVSNVAQLGLFLATIVATSGGTTHSAVVLINVSGVDMTFTATGAFSIIGIGVEPSEGTMVAAQRLLDRTNGSIETDLTALARKSYRNQAAVAGYVVGSSKTAGQLTIEPSSEGISRLLISMFGNPVSTVLVASAGSGATATSAVAGGSVSSLNLTAGGTLYSGTPSVVFTGGGGGVGAMAQATVAGGVVTALNLISGGTGYTTAPTVTIVPAPSFYQHVFSDGFGQGTVSIHEKRGNTYFSFGGCRCNGITATVNKTQADPVTLMFDMMSLYEILDMLPASIALDGSVGYDVNGAFSPTNVAAIFNNTLTAGAQSVTIHPAKAVTERQVLDGYRGPNSHFVEQSNNTGNATLYFGDEIALNKYFGLLETATGARGAAKSIIPVPLKLQITYNVDSSGNTPGLTLLFPAAIYNRVGQPYRGPGVIMQDIAITTQHDPTTGTSFQAILQNYEAAGTSAGQIGAVGTTVTGVPINSQSAYHS